jgi:uncharacterized membrane protein YjgN (DUF898 family)
MAPPPAATAPVSGGLPRRLSFHGSGGTLFGIYVVNILLTIATFGLYRFWGKVRIRRFMLSQTSFEGDRFAYHGTGKELLLGFVKAILFIGLPITAMSMLARLSGDKTIAIARPGVHVVPHLHVHPDCHGRRPALSHEPHLVAGYSLLVPRQGLGLRENLREGLAPEHADAQPLLPVLPGSPAVVHGFEFAFGRRPFHFDGQGRDLFRPYLIALLLLIPTLGFCLFWFHAKKARYFWEHTFFETARFRSTMTGGQLCIQTLGNWALLIVTLGLAWPWVLVRRARFEFTYLTLEGPLDLAGIVQEPQLPTATGDALSSLLGADFGFA